MIPCHWTVYDVLHAPDYAPSPCYAHIDYHTDKSIIILRQFTTRSVRFVQRTTVDFYWTLRLGHMTSNASTRYLCTTTFGHVCVTFYPRRSLIRSCFVSITSVLYSRRN